MLSKKEVKILFLISKGKYFYTDADSEDVNKLISKNLVSFSFGEGDSPYYTDFSLLRDGVIFMERIKKERITQFHVWLNSFISVVAWITAVIAILLGLSR